MTWCCVPYSPSSGGKMGSTMAQAPHISLKCKVIFNNSSRFYFIIFKAFTNSIYFFFNKVHLIERNLDVYKTKLDIDVFYCLGH